MPFVGIEIAMAMAKAALLIIQLARVVAHGPTQRTNVTTIFFTVVSFLVAYSLTCPRKSFESARAGVSHFMTLLTTKNARLLQFHLNREGGLNLALIYNR